MGLTTEQRTEYVRRAADLYRNDEVEWVQSYWLAEIVDGDIQTLEAPPASSRIGSIRGWLRDHGFGTRNRRCGVCAEGALLIALALDETVPDEAIGSDLISEFTTDALRVDDWSDGGADHIYSLNDDYFGSEEDVIELFDRMSRR